MEEEKEQLQLEMYQLQLENQTLQRETLTDLDKNYTR